MEDLETYTEQNNLEEQDQSLLAKSRRKGMARSQLLRHGTDLNPLLYSEMCDEHICLIKDLSLLSVEEFSVQARVISKGPVNEMAVWTMV